MASTLKGKAKGRHDPGHPWRTTSCLITHADKRAVRKRKKSSTKLCAQCRVDTIPMAMHPKNRAIVFCSSKCGRIFMSRQEEL